MALGIANHFRTDHPEKREELRRLADKAVEARKALKDACEAVGFPSHLFY